MKRLMVVFLTFSVAMALFAQDKTIDVKSGKIYVLKSTDGSGQVPIYMATTDEPVDYVPDGTRLRASSGVRSNNKFSVSYGNGGAYYADKSNVVEEVSSLMEMPDLSNFKAEVGRTYVLKSTDGTERVPVFKQGDSIASPYTTYPEGAEVRILSLPTSKKPLVFVRLSSSYSYYVSHENIGEETALSIASGPYVPPKQPT
jgi:hypothetical protein